MLDATRLDQLKNTLNLWLTLLQTCGVPLETFGESNTQLKEFLS